MQERETGGNISENENSLLKLFAFFVLKWLSFN